MSGAAIPTISDVREIPWVVNVPVPPRVLPLHAYYDISDGTWSMYLEEGERKLFRFAPVDMGVGSYYALGPAARDRDLEISIATLITQRLSFPEALPALQKITDDIGNLASIPEKYGLFWSHSARELHSTKLVATEIEYLFVTVRAIYDLMHDLLRSLLQHFGLPNLENPSRPQKLPKLPDSFADIALHGDCLRTREEIEKKYLLPNPLADFYEKEGASFKQIRGLRVAIEHKGYSPDPIFRLESRFAVAASEHPWKALFSWNNAQLKPNSLGSLRLVFLTIIKQVLDVALRLESALCSSIQNMPPAINPDIRVFLRHPFAANLVHLDKAIAQPWEGEEPSYLPKEGDEILPSDLASRRNNT